jgi:hypothetical protein
MLQDDGEKLRFDGGKKVQSLVPATARGCSIQLHDA